MCRQPRRKNLAVIDNKDITFPQETCNIGKTPVLGGSPFSVTNKKTGRVPIA
jgi:hypothetical protein